jgi:uncharacterized membrane protein
MIRMVFLGLHILSASVIFGTGVGIAFFMVRARRTGDAATVAAVSKMVVTANLVFTAIAFVVQPITGIGILVVNRWDPYQPWLLIAYGLYILTLLCWAPALWLQVRMRDLAIEAAKAGQTLPDAYDRLYRRWLILGWPAFAIVIAIFGLMVAQPYMGP